MDLGRIPPAFRRQSVRAVQGVRDNLRRRPVIDHLDAHVDAVSGMQASLFVSDLERPRNRFENV